MATEQLTRLWDNAALARIERHRLGAAHLTANRKGERLSRGRGRSTDFSDYRDYVAGDDIRFVDWNIFARLRRPYLKLFHEEEERHLAILVDRSASMGFEDKLLRACQIASALGLVGLVAGERVSCYAMSAKPGEDPVLLAPSRGKRRLGALLAALEGVEAGGNVAPEQAVERAVARHRGRGVAVVISDFLTEGAVERAFDRLAAAGLEPWVVQILGPSELPAELGGDLRLVDGETLLPLDVSMSAELLSVYHEHRVALERRLADLARRAGGRFLACGSDEDPAELVLTRMRREGWILTR